MQIWAGNLPIKLILGPRDIFLLNVFYNSTSKKKMIPSREATHLRTSLFRYPIVGELRTASLLFPPCPHHPRHKHFTLLCEFCLHSDTPCKVYLSQRAELTKISHRGFKRARTYRETQEVVERGLEGPQPFWIEEGKREEVTGHFSATSLIIHVFTLISDSQVFINKE